MENILNLNMEVFNSSTFSDHVVIEGKNGYMMVVQINSDGEIDYTVYDDNCSDIDGGVYENDNITYKELFEFAGFIEFDGMSRLLCDEDKEEYLERL